MTEADLPGAERLTAASYHAVDHQLAPAAAASAALASLRAAPGPGPRSGERRAAWVERTGHLLRTDPGGSWVAERDGELVGVAVSFRRELMWILASYAVRVGLRGHGIGRVLLEASREHGRGCLRAMLASSADPAAVRRYRLAGFTLHPQMMLVGVVDRSALPIVDRVREGTPGDLDLLDSLDRRTRGAAHGPDHQLLLRRLRLLVTDRTTGAGYAYVGETGAPELLAASNRRTASDLLWESLASSPAGQPVRVEHVTAANQWALDVGLAARLGVHQRGYLGLHHLRPPTPYLHHGALL